MRPASHMPLAERITFGRLSALMALEASLVTAGIRPETPIGFSPRCT